MNIINKYGNTIYSNNHLKDSFDSSFFMQANRTVLSMVILLPNSSGSSWAI